MHRRNDIIMCETRLMGRHWQLVSRFREKEKAAPQSNAIRLPLQPRAPKGCVSPISTPVRRAFGTGWGKAVVAMPDGYLTRV